MLLAFPTASPAPPPECDVFGALRSLISDGSAEARAFHLDTARRLRTERRITADELAALEAAYTSADDPRHHESVRGPERSL